MSVLVCQAIIGETCNHNVCVDVTTASVKKWAVKHRYDYMLKTNQLYNLKPHMVKYEFLQYYQMYDYIIWMDNDVYINSHAPLFPLQNGFTAALDCVNNHCDHPFIKQTQDKYINSGVWSADYMTALSLQDFFSTYRSDYKYAVGNLVTVDQQLLNHHLAVNNIKQNIISDKWNMMRHKKGWANKKDAYAVHFAGPQKVKSIEILNYHLSNK